jgi:hypothetical protein
MTNATFHDPAAPVQDAKGAGSLQGPRVGDMKGTVPLCNAYISNIFSSWRGSRRDVLSQQCGGGTCLEREYSRQFNKFTGYTSVTCWFINYRSVKIFECVKSEFGFGLSKGLDLLVLFSRWVVGINTACLSSSGVK